MTKEEFHSLKNIWLEDTKFLSSMTKMRKHIAFKAIVAAGESVIPWILEDMQKHNDFLFMALYDITGENPVPEEHQGDIVAINQDWLKWGKDKKYID